jgi:hypothetical protein
MMRSFGFSSTFNAIAVSPVRFYGLILQASFYKAASVTSGQRRCFSIRLSQSLTIMVKALLIASTGTAVRKRSSSYLSRG